MNILLPAFIILLSFALVSLEASKHYIKTIKRNSSSQTLINDQDYIKHSKSYGTIHKDDSSSSRSNTSFDIETKSCRWTVFTISRIIFSIAQTIIFIYAFQRSLQNIDNSSNKVKTDTVHDCIIYMVHNILWVSKGLIKAYLFTLQQRLSIKVFFFLV